MRIIGRRDELAVVEAFLDDPGRRLLLLAGEIGIGKTVLWEAAVAAAERRGHRVLSARPVQAEAPLVYAALGDLLEAVPEDAWAGLPAPQWRALRVALVRDDAGEEGADPRSVATAVLGVLRALADRGPVLLAIDDASWLDAATARVLGFALRRLGRAPVRVVVTARTDDRGAVPPLATDVVGVDQTMLVTPDPLSLGAVRALLDDRLGVIPPHRLLARLHETSGGNPYFALELGRSLGSRATVELGEELAESSGLRRLVHQRVAGLPDSVRETLLVAALTPDAPVHVVAAAARSTASTRSTPSAPARSDATLADLDAAVAAGIVEIRHGAVAFTHPLLRSVVVGDALPAQRRAAHERLAGVVPSSIERAGHAARAATAPDETVAAALDEAARDAYRQGARETAAELAELALQATPTAAADDRRRRAMAAAEYHFESGDPAGARAHADAVVATLPAGPPRAMALARQALYQRYCAEPLATWTATLRQALAEAAADDFHLLADIHGALGMAGMNGGDAATVPGHLAAIDEIACRTGDAALLVVAAGGKAWLAFLAGGGIRHDLIDAALKPVNGTERLAVETRPSYMAVSALVLSGELPAARAVLDRECADAADRGDEAGLPILLWQLVLVETWAGDWARAALLAEQGRQAAEFAESPPGSAFMAAAHAHLLVDRGLLEQARAEIDTAVGLSRSMALTSSQYFTIWAAGRLELSAGDPAAAHAVLAPAMSDLGTPGPPGLIGPMLVPDEVEALVRLGDPVAARRLLEAWRARTEAVGGTRGRVIVARCSGLLLAAEGDLDGAVRTVDAGLALCGDLGMPLEHGRTLLVAGEIHRRARHRRLAEQHFTAAREVFAGLGAEAWLARCDAELARYSGRATESAALTSTERRVAELAAEGRTTREIATAVFASSRTVEAHLQRVYLKLGVHSRVELNRRLAEIAATAPRSLS